MAGAQQLALDLGHRAALDREDFLVADSNAEAVAWIDRWPDWPSPILVLHGPSGSGKSHLIQVWRAAAGARVLPASQLSTAEVGDLADKGLALEDWRQGYDETALFHLINLIAENGHHLIVTVDRPPARMAIGLADLASRLRAAASAELRQPDDALLLAVLVKLFADRQLRVAPDLPSFLLPRIERSFAAARRTVDALDRMALAKQRRITVPLAREVLAAMGEGNIEGG